MNTTLLNRFRSQNPGFDQFRNLDSETLQNWIHDLETERGWKQDPALVTARTKIEDELQQRQAKEKEVEREQLLYPDHCGRPPRYATEEERQLAIRTQNREAVKRFRAKHAGKPLPSLPTETWSKFVSACSSRGLDPITEFTATLNRVLGQSNVDFGVPEQAPASKEPSNVEF